MNKTGIQHAPVTQQQRVKKLYKKRAKHYDFTANLYYLLGFREYAYRKRAIELLDLKAGDTVVEIGCGTGLNFSLLQDKVGPNGKIIGVDLTTEMLEVARQRCESNDWDNVELVEHDAATFVFPGNVDGIISTFALTLVPEFHAVISNAAGALKPSKRMVLLDLKLPRWPQPLIKLAIWLTGGFGVNEEIARRHPWESMEQAFNNVRKVETFFGAVYIAMSERR